MTAREHNVEFIKVNQSGQWALKGSYRLQESAGDELRMSSSLYRIDVIHAEKHETSV